MHPYYNLWHLRDSQQESHPDHLQAGVNGAQQAGSWAVRETFVAVIIGNLPMIHPLFSRTIVKISSSLSSRRTTEGSGNVLSLKDLPRFSRKPRTANPLSVSSSAEQIIDSRLKKNHAAAREPDKSVPRGIQVVSQTTVGSDRVDKVGDDPLVGGQSRCVISA